MMTITALPIAEEEANYYEVKCELVDNASVFAAEAKGLHTFERCPMTPIWSVAFKPAEDMVIPTFLCSIHFNALKLSLHEGVGVDEDVFGEFPNH